MRRMGFCEEKGSGMDKALSAIEKYQLPPIKYRVSDIRTTIILSAYKTWSQTSKEERVQACYQHACLKYLANEMLTNKSLRERLGVDEKNYPLTHFPSQAILQIIFTFPLMAHYGVAGALLASRIIFLYDGTRGFIRSKAAKYSFYAIYPVISCNERGDIE